ncbi:MAG: DNA-directed RNA polymerase subunit omega, partial [Clostridiales bacterium]|nr:DNA-directed RNA polymerase subunit omega [Clostridiales bacterium]
MVSPTMNKLFDKVDSKYTLVVAVAKRARQLVDGQSSLVETNSL